MASLNFVPARDLRSDIDRGPSALCGPKIALIRMAPNRVEVGGSAALDSSPEVFHEQRELGSESLQLIGHGRDVSVPVIVDRSLKGSGHEAIALQKALEAESEGGIRTWLSSSSPLTGIHDGTKLVGAGAHGLRTSAECFGSDISGQEQ